MFRIWKCGTKRGDVNVGLHRERIADQDVPAPVCWLGRGAHDVAFGTRCQCADPCHRQHVIAQAK